MACVALLVTSSTLSADEKAQGKERLKIVFLMGQSNMVGYYHPSTAWYLTQPIYAPPTEAAMVHDPNFNWDNFYWSGARFAFGDSDEYNAKTKAMLEEREDLRKMWRGRVYGDTGYSNDWKGWKKEWGPRPGNHGEGWRGDMQNFLAEKAAESEEYKKALNIISRATTRGAGATHYHGSAKFIFLTGDAMARKLTNLMQGNEPTIFKETEEILNGN